MNRFTTEVRDNYIYMRILGEQASIEYSRQIIHAMTKACEQHDCYNVLGESFLTEPMSGSQMAKHKNIFTEMKLPKPIRLAWVNHNKSVAMSSKFGLMLLRKSGLVEGKPFKTIDEAIDWLLIEQPVE